MKLKVNGGEIALPEDFSFEIEKNSAFFSDEGSSSVAANLPGTPGNLALLEHPTRPAKSTRRSNLFPATLMQGVIHKNGQLVVESASRDGISCALALEDSDFYSRYSDTPLKELFSLKILTTYSTPAEWYAWLYRVYTGEIVNDLRIIPVAVNKEGDTYQVNNEPVNDQSETFPLNHEARIVKEGDDDIDVPDGYGIAPFLLLSAFLEQMFELCGYSVNHNCFATDDDLNKLILLHSCSDVICKGVLNYSDLVPGKTIGETLEWMRCKFHAQIVCYPGSASVDILLLEDILAANFDYDLTGKLVQGITSSFSKASRVVIRPNTSLDNAAPAADTIDDLQRKYGSLVEVAEYETWPELCLVFRKATGEYFLSRASSAHIIRTGADGTSSGRGDRYLGTNYFTHDRQDTPDAEEFSPEDLMPPMVFVKGILMPYIGNRRHRNTSYKQDDHDEEQEIIVVEYVGRSSTSGVSLIGSRTGGGRRSTGQSDASGRYFYGTTQKYGNTGALRQGRYNITPDGIFERFFRRYDTMLRNCLVKMTGHFDIPVDQLMRWSMYSMKILNGQRLLPVKMTYEVGRQTRCLSAEFYLVKEYSDADQDQPVEFSAPVAKWVLNDSEVTSAVAQAQTQHSEHTLEAKYDDAYSSGEKTILMGPPTAIGQSSARITRTISIGYYYFPSGHGIVGSGRQWSELSRADVHIWFDSVAW